MNSFPSNSAIESINSFNESKIGDQIDGGVVVAKVSFIPPKAVSQVAEVSWTEPLIM